MNSSFCSGIFQVDPDSLTNATSELGP